MLGVPLTIDAALRAKTCCWRSASNQETAHLAGRYLDGLGWSLIPAWWFIALRSFMGAVNRPEPALWITLAPSR